MPKYQYADWLYLHQGGDETEEGDGDCVFSPGLLNLHQQVAIVTCLHALSAREGEKMGLF